MITLYSEDFLTFLRTCEAKRFPLVLTDLSGIVPSSRVIYEAVRVCSGMLYIFCRAHEISKIIEWFEMGGLATRVCAWKGREQLTLCAVGSRRELGPIDLVWDYPEVEQPIWTHQMPVALARRIILDSSSRNDEVLDFAMGSGTTGVAAVECDRGFVGVDISEAAVALASERIVDKVEPINNNRVTVLSTAEAISSTLEATA